MTGHFWPAGTLMRSPLLRGILGVKVRPAPVVPIGHPVRIVTGDVYAHPLDIIAIEHRNPHDRLDAAAGWIRDDTATRYDVAIAKLERDGVHDRLTIALAGLERAIRDVRGMARQSEAWRDSIRRGARGAIPYSSHNGTGVAIDIDMRRPS